MPQIYVVSTKRNKVVRLQLPFFISTMYACFDTDRLGLNRVDITPDHEKMAAEREGKRWRGNAKSGKICKLLVQVLIRLIILKIPDRKTIYITEFVCNDALIYWEGFHGKF